MISKKVAMKTVESIRTKVPLSFITMASYYFTSRRSISKTSPRSVIPVETMVDDPSTLKPLRVIMDIDECMVHAHLFGDEEDVNKVSRQKKNYSVERSKLELAASKSSPLVESKRIMMEDNTPVHIRIRPGLTEFLTEVSKIADVYAFTAGLPVYARPVLKEIDPDGTIFKECLFRDKCTQLRAADSTFYSKDLKSFGQDVFDDERTILVDNNILSFAMQPNNGIHICEFYDNSQDRELEKVLDLITYLSLVPDVRVPLKNIFQLESNLRQIGINMPSWSKRGAASK